MEIEGFTELSYNGEIYRASPNYHSYEWYDWAHVLHPKDNREMQGKILGFFRYKTPGYPSYRSIEMSGMSVADVRNANEREDTVYMIFHACTNWRSRESLEKSFSVPLKLAPGDSYTYCLPVSCIRGPIAAIPDFGASDSLQYLSSLPYHKWGKIFVDKVNKSM